MKVHFFKNHQHNANTMTKIMNISSLSRGCFFGTFLSGQVGEEALQWKGVLIDKVVFNEHFRRIRFCIRFQSKLQTNMKNEARGPPKCEN